MYQQLIDFVTQYSKSFLYFGVGSCPHAPTPQDLQPKWDQLLPCFVKDIAQNKSERIQIIHIDPQFAYKKEFLREYFTLNLPDSIYYEIEDKLFIWESEKMQVICVATRFHHPSSHNEENDEWFLETLTDEALAHGFRMVYQEYTGVETKDLFLRLYGMCDENLKRRFRNLVLFDVSYGNDTGCSTDMVKYKPLYEPNGMFLNLQLYSDQELLDRINTHPAINERLMRTIIGKYRKTLNEIHVDYRRTLNGDSLFHPTEYSYRDGSPASDIMICLEEELFRLVPLLQKLGVLSNVQVQNLRELFQNYTTMDRYKWYDAAFQLVKFEAGVSNACVPA